MSRSRAGSGYPGVISRKKIAHEGQEVEGRIIFFFFSVPKTVFSGHKDMDRAPLLSGS